MKVKDSSGTIVNGLIRTPGGGLVVDSPTEYYKYMKDKESKAKITHLEQEIDQLKQLVQKLLEKNNG